ncbi:MAG TPA: alkylhydroperoxidase-related (seleno)protein [Acidimicrobiales bacterium]|nr:alkylhydroperoxidase-related (seleno)protein [Acidimicrobiales bacterium]
MLLTGAIVPLDHEIAAAVDDVWSALGRPGRWLSGAERVALAAECRAAAAGRRGDDPLLDAHRRDLVARIVHDPAGLHDLADDELLGDLLVDEYVELAAVASKVVAVDHLVAGLGARTLPLPTPLPGEPTRVRPAGAADLGARVPMLTPDQLADEIGPGTYHVNVRRAHSLVPEEAAQQIRLVEACYVPDLLAHGLEGRRGLQRAQIEALATRVSSLNRCFYCSAGHALLLTASGAEDGADVVGASQGGDAGIDHGIELLALADAMVRDQPPLVEARAACAAVLDDTQLLGAVATVAAFVLLNRVADTSGIALDAMAAGALDALPAELGLDAAPGARRTGEV